MRSIVLVPLLAVVLVSFVVLGCGAGTDLPPGGEKVAPRGALYEYRVPSGFESTDPLHTEKNDSMFSTGVASPKTIGGAGVVVSQYPFRPVHSAADVVRLIPEFETEIGATARTTEADSWKVKPARFPGHPALRWVLDGMHSGAFPDTSLETLMIFPSTGTGAVSVSCRWGSANDEQTVVRQGCKSLMQSLRVN
jgi:hypothetical protein